MNAAATWRRFVATAGEYDVEGPLDDATAPITTYFPGAPSRRLVFVTKNAVARWNDLFPAATAIFVLHGPATAQHCGFLRRIVGERPVLFFGDLDPMDLTTFGTLRAGGTDWDNNPATKINVQYRGIDDDVLRVAEENRAWDVAAFPRPPGHPIPSLSGVLIPMQPVERRHFKVLCRLMPDLRKLVGPRAFDLLQDGWKLEVEALSFRRALMLKLFRRILDLGK